MKNNAVLLAFGSAILLLLALLDMEYSYYEFLRLAIFSSALFSVWACHREGASGFILPMAILVLLFNPLIPMEFERDTWVPIDLIGAGAFIAMGVKIVGWDISRIYVRKLARQWTGQKVDEGTSAYETFMMNVGFVVMAIIIPATCAIKPYSLWWPILSGLLGGLCTGYVLGTERGRPVSFVATVALAGVACAALSYTFVGPMLPR